MAPVLFGKRLLIVTGKGGVGKSTVSAALALSSARQGLRTLVCEVNAKERVAPLLGHPEVGPEIKEIEPNLFAVDVRPNEAMREYALMILKFESVYNAVFENRLVRYFLRFIPSLQELVLLGKILFHLKEKRPDGSWRFERIIIDAPATGHAISFFSVPQVIVDTVPPGTLSNDARWMRDFLVDESVTAALLVCLPEEMPVNETIELHAALKQRVHLEPQAVILNSCVPTRFDGPLVGQSTDLSNVVRAHTGRAALTVSSVEKLSTLKLPVIQVPRIFTPDFGREAIEQIAGHLEPLWRAS